MHVPVGSTTSLCSDSRSSVTWSSTAASCVPLASRLGPALLLPVLLWTASPARPSEPPQPRAGADDAATEWQRPPRQQGAERADGEPQPAAKAAPAEPDQPEPGDAPSDSAEPPEAPSRRFVFDGFATVGLAHSSEERADFAAGLSRPEGPGFTDEWSAEVDSRLGLQLTAHATRKLSFVVQVVVEQQHDDQVEPTLEWANLKYAVTDDFSLRIGRTALPGFFASDYRKVGYAYPWVRPPVEFYGLAPLFNSDGLDASYRHRLAGWTHSLQANLGVSDFEIPGDVEVEIDDVVGFHDTWERGSLTLRGTLTHSRISVDSTRGLFDAFRSFGTGGQALADRFDVDDNRLRFVALGASFDPGDWFVTAELGRIRTGSFIGDRTAGHVTAGYRVGKFTPYGVYAESTADSPLSSPGLTVADLPPPLQPVAVALNGVLNNLLSSLVVQRTVSLGARWDFHANAAFKVQVDRIDVGAGSTGTFVRRQPGFRTGGETTLVSFNVDFVF